MDAIKQLEKESIKGYEQLKKMVKDMDLPKEDRKKLNQIIKQTENSIKLMQKTIKNGIS